MRPKLTIGMATYDDFSGLFPTIQSLRLNNAQLMGQCEFVVVNNNPEDTKTANAIKALLGVHNDANDPPDRKLDYTRGVRGSLPDCLGTCYVDMPGNKGTSLSREAIFTHATGEFVLVMDCHLELWPGALAALMGHFAADPQSIDIVSGPLLLDSLRDVNTHFNDSWGDGMWGQWGKAWKCQCGDQGAEFSLLKSENADKQSVAVPVLLQLGNKEITVCPACRRRIPQFVWNGHEQMYVALGFFPLGMNDGPAFEIPGQGLGLFACRREAWPHFHAHALGFGGEELYIHEKFRHRGGRALCLPGLKWNHRFYRTGGAKYPNTNYWKARNYVLEFQELGFPLETVRKHFVDDAQLISPLAWDALEADAIHNTTDPTDRILAIQRAGTLLPHLTTIDALFDEVKVIPRDLNEHMDVLRALTDQAGGVVVELTGRRESTLAFLAGRPQKVVAYSTEVDNHCYKAAHLVSDTTQFVPLNYQMGALVLDLPDNDLCFIDTYHRYDQITQELNTYSPHCRRFIVLHDTEIYGQRGDDNGLGLIQAIGEFTEAHPEWAVIDHTKQQFGLTVLSRNPDDRPATPVEGFKLPRGPGTELKKILHSLGIHPAPSCNCNSKAIQMDVWGIAGCEENFDTIVTWLKNGTWTGLDVVSAGFRAFFNGLAFRIDPTKPFDSLVSLCIKRAIEAENALKRTA